MVNMPAFWKRVHEAMELHPSWRYGQAMFNVLYDMYPDLANEIRGTKYDPFHDSTRQNDFLSFINSRGNCNA